MSTRLSVARFTWALALGVVSQTGGCDRDRCPEPVPFESGNYEIVGLVYGHPRLEDQWLFETVVGAHMSVDQDAGEVTIRYTKDDTTYEVRYTIEGTEP